jgi:hypothetical protein
MSLLILFAEQNGVLQGALRGAIIGAVAGALAGPIIWGVRKLQNRGQKKEPDEPDRTTNG